MMIPITHELLRRWTTPAKSSTTANYQLSAIGYRLSALGFRLLALVSLALLLTGLVFLITQPYRSTASGYVRPDFAIRMVSLRPIILEAARRHNHPALSHMSDEEFAVVIAQVLYNEHFGWLEEAMPPLQVFTPLYQEIQVQLNIRAGANLSIWPANLRPSVAEEILKGEIPLPAPKTAMYTTISVHGSHIRLSDYDNNASLNDALSNEIRRPELAVEYVAANLERGVLRANYEGVPVSWQSLAAWHNQGIVSTADIRKNATASDYIRRAAAYRGLAETLILGQPQGERAGEQANRRAGE